MMQGLGFYIWQLKTVGSLERTLEALRYCGATWVSIKVADGTTKYNQVNSAGNPSGKDDYLLSFIQGLQAAGIHVGGWHFIYPLPTLKPGLQAAVMGERVQKLGLQHVLIDAEQWTKGGAYWITLADGRLNPDRKVSATTYMNQLRPAGVPLSMPVALSSYRFPKYFLNFPFKQFVNAKDATEGVEICEFIAQQMYWVGAHNPGEQLIRSINEYNTTVRTDLAPLPFVPFGAAYGDGSWLPSAKDFKEFISTAKSQNCPAWGFWSLDWIISHNKRDWLEAMRESEPPPPPPPPPPPTPVQLRFVVLPCDYLNVRSSPRADSTRNIVGKLYTGNEFNTKDLGGLNCWAQIKDGTFSGNWVVIVLNENRMCEPVSDNVYKVQEETTPFLNVRTCPNTTCRDVGDINPGTHFTVQNAGGESAWAQIKGGQYDGRWCAITYKGKRYCKPV